MAIVGAGMIAAVHRRAALLAGAEIVGVLASGPERSAAAAAAWGTAPFADIHQVAAADVDLVHVTSPNATHAPYVHTLLAAGKHLICEKPLGLDLAESAEMVEAARRAGVVATVPFVYRYHPLVREIRERVRQGEFGDWYLLHGCYLQDWMLSPDSSNWRVDPARGGASRAVADIGSHWCDLVEWVSGERFTAVSAQTSVAVDTRPTTTTGTFDGSPAVQDAARSTVHTEDSAVILLRSAAGVLGNLTVSQVAAGRRNRLWFELDGSRASAVFDQENPEQVWIGEPDGARLLVRDPSTGSAEQRRLSSLPAGHVQGYAQCFDSFVADTYAAVDGAEPPGLPSFADGLRAAEFVDAVLRSATSGKWEDVQ